jgi:hypothetical protein
MTVREPLYRSTAHFSVLTDRRRVQAVADEIAAGLDALS